MAGANNEAPPTRATGNLERFNIVRNHIAFYNNVGVVVRYRVPTSFFQNGIESLIYAALNETLRHHPILGVTVEDEDTKEPKWKRLDSIDLRDMVKFIDADPNTSLDAWVQEAHHVPFASPETLPLWRIVVACQPLPAINETHLQFVVGFFPHHGIADGLSCAAFHQTFLSALNSSLGILDSPVIHVPKLALLPNLEMKDPLSISILYTLKAIFKTFIYDPVDPLIWSGPPISETTPRPPLCRVQSFFLPPGLVNALVSRCREQQSSVTALVTVLVAKKIATFYPTHKRFISQVPFSIRKLTGFGPRDMGCFVSNAEPAFSSETNPPTGYIACVTDNEDGNEALWNSARKCKNFIAEKTATMHNQNINLLKFVPDLKAFFLGMLGGKRAHAFEVTNIGVVDGGSDDDGRASFDRVMFSTGSCTFGCPYIIHIATAKNGDMVLTCSWEVGVVEDEKVGELLEWLEGELKSLAGS